MSQKRKNYLTWDEYFMSIVLLSSLKGECNYEGACIVARDNRILSIGYEDSPDTIKRNYNDKKFITSALSNAIYTFNGRRCEFEGGTVYLSSFPTCEESRWISQGKFSRVVYLNKKISSEEEEVSRILLSYAEVKVEPYFDNYYSLDYYHNFLKELYFVMKKYIGLDDSVSLLDDEYFMGISVLSALRSKDPSTQVGACLVDGSNHILSVGYNGATYKMSDDVFPWASFGEEIGDLVTTKDPYIVHAEINVFDNYRGMPSDFVGGKLYLIYSPCERCSMRVSYTSIEKIIALRKYTKNGTFDRSNAWLLSSNILFENYNKDKDYTKDECIEMFSETTKVIKKNLKR